MGDVPFALSEALSDRYILERVLGHGGMATVYLAQDKRHDRRVAVKVLQPELVAVIGAERFLAEIKLTANLQHPHILPLHDSGEADSFLFYVMPYVAGESLRDRLTRDKQLPVNEAIRIATEVASALGYAHRHGVVHRDIKPENILLHEGQALVADFGIALAVSSASGKRITETGLSLGTPHYMSPEQAMGEREITPGSDIYALGCVLYEMLTGDPPFTGSTAQAIVARVLTEAPRPLIPQRHTIPPHIEAAVLTAMEKLPADRFATAAQFAEALTTGVTWPTASPRPPATPARGSRLKRADPVVLGLAVVTLASLGLAATQLRRPAGAPQLSPIRFLISGTDSAPIVENYPWPAAISPDGGRLVYAVVQGGAPAVLYSRRTDQLEGHPIPGTSGGSQPVFSPDGQWLAFEAGDKEKKVRFDGSAPVTIAEGGWNNGADWTTTNELVVGSTRKRRGLLHVPVAGGELVQLTRPDSARGEQDHLWPIAHPDGRTIVFAVWSGSLATSELAMTSLGDGTVVRLGLKGIRPLAVLDGALVYLQVDGAVMAVPLDVAHKRVDGSPVPVLDPVPVASANNGNSGVFVSRGGALVSSLATRRGRLTWIERTGRTRPISPEVRDFSVVRLSPDGRRLASIVADGSKSDVWIYEIETGTLSRLTSSENVTSAAWTKDGSRVVYPAAGAESGAAVWTKSVDVATAPEKLVEVSDATASAEISPDGRSLLLQSLLENGWDLVRVSLDSSRTSREFSTSKAVEAAPRFSPDGRWVAVVSDESGAFEVYIRSYPEPTLKLQVSVGGGDAPVWSADGTRLYYYSGSNIVEARLSTTPAMRVVSRATAFTQIRYGNDGSGHANFDVSRDGSRIAIPVPQSGSYSLIVVPNWLTEFRQRMAAGKGP